MSPMDYPTLPIGFYLNGPGMLCTDVLFQLCSLQDAHIIIYNIINHSLNKLIALFPLKNTTVVAIVKSFACSDRLFCILSSCSPVSPVQYDFRCD